MLRNSVKVQLEGSSICKLKSPTKLILSKLTVTDERKLGNSLIQEIIAGFGGR